MLALAKKLIINNFRIKFVHVYNVGFISYLFSPVCTTMSMEDGTQAVLKAGMTDVAWLFGRSHVAHPDEMQPAHEHSQAAVLLQTCEATTDESHRYDHLVLRPGELHFVMAQLRAIGSCIKNNGLHLDGRQPVRPLDGETNLRGKACQKWSGCSSDFPASPFHDVPRSVLRAEP